MWEIQHMWSKDASLTLHTERETLAVRIFNKSGVLVGSVSILYGNNYEIQIFVNDTKLQSSVQFLKKMKYPNTKVLLPCCSEKMG